MSNYRRYYLQNHYIFITVVTFNRLPILIDNIDLLRKAFNKSMRNYNYELYSAVIMPDHFHIIIKPEQPEDSSKIIGSIKKHFTYNYNIGASERRTLPQSREKRKESNVWQRRFYDHIIRDEEDLFKHLDYIHYNPVKHYNISPNNWEYSSFKKFVRNGFYENDWYNLEDKHNIVTMDLE